MSIADYLGGREILKQPTNDASTAANEVQTKRIELVDITEKARPYGDQPLISLTSSYYKARDTIGKYDDCALLLRRKLDKDGDERSTVLEVRSSFIRNALKLLLSTYGYLNLEACPIEIKKPYDALFHYRNEIRAYAAAAERTAEEMQHIQVLVKFMEENLKKTEQSFTQMVPKGMVDFKYLWTLFRAEDVVVAQADHYRQCYRVVSCGNTTVDGQGFFDIHVWSWGYNGFKFGPVEDRLRIPEFTVAKKIMTLPFYPLAMLPQREQSTFKKELIRRGELWRNMVNVSHIHYEGPAWIDPPFEAAKSMADLVMSHINCRVILDHRSHERENFRLATTLYGSRGSIPSPSRIHGSRRRDPFFDLENMWSNSKDKAELPAADGSLSDMKCYENEDSYKITEDQALLAPARVRGYSLTNKTWTFFLLDRLSEVRWNTDAFSSLEIDPTTKTYIRSLVESHSSEDNVFDDVITDKGKGLIMLLHGPPGTGKTLTAESIADFTRKPLYHISTAELGTSVSITEPVLMKIFGYAKEWGAILLLDEADCFLSKRTTDDMERNAFVTIFLRLLEYYQGILFLTTNRIEEFDPAFQSRIHLGVEYTELDATRRACVWKNLLSRIRTCEKWDDQSYERLGRNIAVNGREIKNLIRTTLAITQQSGGLTEDALMAVYRLNLKRPMKMVKGDS